MSQFSPRSKPSPPSKSPPTRRLQTPQERFGLASEPDAPELFLVEDSTRSEPTHSGDESRPDDHEVEPNDPFAPYVRPKLQTRQHSPRRHELKQHQVRPHELKRHEVKRLERERLDPVGQAARGPLVANGSPARRAQKQKRTRKFLGRFLGTAFVFFIGYCGVAAFSAPQFAVKTVEVEGLRDTPRTKVEAITRTLVGQNFFRANRAQVERSVGALPTVDSAQLVRGAHWPPRFKLVVTERQPTLRVGAGAKWWVVDKKGLPYREAGPQDEDLYALTAPQFEPQTGKPLPAHWWSRAMELEKALRSDNALASGAPAGAGVQTVGTKNGNPPFWQLRRLYFDRHGMASVRVSGQGMLRPHNEMLIRLGESDWAPKLARARVALAYFERTGRVAQELDLVSYTYPTWHARVDNSSGDGEGTRVGTVDNAIQHHQNARHIS